MLIKKKINNYRIVVTQQPHRRQLSRKIVFERKAFAVKNTYERCAVILYRILYEKEEKVEEEEEEKKQVSRRGYNLA